MSIEPVRLTTSDPEVFGPLNHLLPHLNPKSHFLETVAAARAKKGGATQKGKTPYMHNSFLALILPVLNTLS